MADIFNISEFIKKAQEDELKEYCKKQYAVIEKSYNRVKELEHQVAHLEQLLRDGMPLLNPVQSIIITPEQGLLERQVELLSEIGLDKHLSLEETKRLDLLLKNLNIIKGKPHDLPGKPIEIKKLSTSELLKIASDDQE